MAMEKLQLLIDIAAILLFFLSDRASSISPPEITKQVADDAANGSADKTVSQIQSERDYPKSTGKVALLIVCIVLLIVIFCGVSLHQSFRFSQTTYIQTLAYVILRRCIFKHGHGHAKNEVAEDAVSANKTDRTQGSSSTSSATAVSQGNGEENGNSSEREE
jgi:hypothetical protein